LACALCAFLLGGALPAYAQTDDENARRHFESGVAYLQQSNYEDALREFQSSYALSKRPELLLNIANVYERMGKLQEAVDALTKFLELQPATPERGTHETRIANLKKRIEEQKPAPAPTASASAAPAKAPAPAPPPPSRAPNRTPAYIAFGVGGAAGIAALITGLVANADFNDAEATCKPGCDDSRVSSIKSMALVSTILTGVAVVGVGTGAVLYFTAKPSEQVGVTATWRF
jgi:tetratricopeptide (TPR) repeat protein